MFFAVEHGLQLWGVNIAVRLPCFHILGSSILSMCEDSYPLHCYLSLGAHCLSTDKANRRVVYSRSTSRIFRSWRVFCQMPVALTASWSTLTQVIYQKYSKVKLVSPILSISRFMAMSCELRDHLGYGKLLSLEKECYSSGTVCRKIVCSSRILKPFNTFFTPQAGVPQGLINNSPNVRTYYRVWFSEMAGKNRDFPHFNGPGSIVGRWWTYTIFIEDCR